MKRFVPKAGVWGVDKQYAWRNYLFMPYIPDSASASLDISSSQNISSILNHLSSIVLVTWLVWSGSKLLCPVYTLSETTGASQ